MKTNELKEMLLKEETNVFSGWDFSYLKNRWKDEQIPWDYYEIIKEYLKDDMNLLDMGTGGGEFLLTLNHPYENTYVSEGYEPNVELCRQKLSPLGITVEKSVGEEIPYESEQFDIIINRHESYDIQEVYRCLKPQGIFITQQIGCENDMDLVRRIDPEAKLRFPDKNLAYAIEEAEKEKFIILKQEEAITPILFYDLGAFVYFAKIIEWEFIDFSVETCFEQLLDMQKEIDEKGYLQGSEHRYLMVLKKV